MGRVRDTPPVTQPAVAGVGMTPFSGGADASVLELAEEAARDALADAGVEPAELRSVHVGNMASGSFNDTTGMANALCGSLGVVGAQVDRVENTSAGGVHSLRRRGRRRVRTRDGDID